MNLFEEKAVRFTIKDNLIDKLVLLILIFLSSSSFIIISSGSELYSFGISPSQIQESENAIEQQEITEDFSIIVLPDTQHYSQYYPEIFINQTKWIVDKKSDLNVAFVSSMGDIVQNGNSVSEWENAAGSMKILDEGGVSWEVLPGNHDFESDGNLSNYNIYFGIGNFSGKPWFGGSYPNGSNNNNFALFSSGGYDYLFFSFQYHPSDLVLAWANETIAQHHSRKVIVATHDYLDLNGERRDEGNHIWNSFVAPHAEQVFLVLCGHMHGEAIRTDYVNGYKVHQLVADYQDRSNGGNGWLRILEFHPADDKIIVKTFSPYLGSYESDVDSQFWLDCEMKNLLVPSLTPTPSLLLPTPTIAPQPTATPSVSYIPPFTPEPTTTASPEPALKIAEITVALIISIVLVATLAHVIIIKRKHQPQP